MIDKPKPIELKKAWKCDWCHTIYESEHEAYNCCDE